MSTTMLPVMKFACIHLSNFFFYGSTALYGPKPPHFVEVSRSHTFETHHTSMPPMGFEPTILVSERPKTHALDRMATGIGSLWFIACKFVAHQAIEASSPRLMIHAVAHISSYEHSASYFTLQWQQEFMCSKSAFVAREILQNRAAKTPSPRLTNEARLLCDSTRFLRTPNCTYLRDFRLPPRCKWGLRSSGMLRRVEW